MSGISGTADRPRGFLSAVASGAAGWRGWRAFAGPAALLLAVTIAVVVVRSTRETESPGPSPSHVSRAKTPTPPPRRFYTVVPGDTLAGIAGKTDVPLAKIRALNPGVAPTALFVDQKIRVR